MARLQIEQLSKQYGPVTAVREVSLDVRDGEFELSPVLVRALCDRHVGIGADGVLRVVRSEHDPDGRPMAGAAPFFMDYRNADGSPKYPQRKDLSVLSNGQFQTMGGRTETGAITTKVMVIEGRGDASSWPIFNVSYAEMIRRTLGTAKAEEMVRFYLHDNGRHGVGGGEPGVWQQSMQDLMTWAEKGIAPPPSTTILPIVIATARVFCRQFCRRTRRSISSSCFSAPMT